MAFTYCGTNIKFDFVCQIKRRYPTWYNDPRSRLRYYRFERVNLNSEFSRSWKEFESLVLRGMWRKSQILVWRKMTTKTILTDIILYITRYIFLTINEDVFPIDILPGSILNSFIIDDAGVHISTRVPSSVAVLRLRSMPGYRTIFGRDSVIGFIPFLYIARICILWWLYWLSEFDELSIKHELTYDIRNTLTLSWISILVIATLPPSPVHLNSSSSPSWKDSLFSVTVIVGFPAVAPTRKGIQIEKNIYCTKKLCLVSAKIKDSRFVFRTSPRAIFRERWISVLFLMIIYSRQYTTSGLW